MVKHVVSVAVFSLLAAAGCHKDKGAGHDGGTGNDASVDLAAIGGADLSSGADLAQLTITIRDFKMYSQTDSTTNPDFENAQGDDKEIVTDTLGADHKPVYKNATGTTATTHGKAGFDEWYNDTPGKNIHVDYPVLLTQNSDGSLAYDNNAFFPIDDGGPHATAFGNQGEPHNYSFTAESHNTFVYAGGETFHYRGDDDVFVYINNKLVINLGGVHVAEDADVTVDSLGLTVGQSYPLDFFFAERHTVASDVLLQTTLGLTPVTIN